MEIRNFHFADFLSLSLGNRDDKFGAYIGTDTCERGGLGEAITAVDFSDNTVQ